MTAASANPRDAMYDRAQLLRRGSCWCTSRPPHVAGFTYVRAVGRASQTLRGVSWFEVLQTRGQVDAGKVNYQVVLKVGFTLEEP